MEEVDKFILYFHMNSEMTAIVYVKDKILEDAILGPYGGLNVLALLSDNVSGHFDLCSWREPESKSIHLPASSALLTATVKFDENKKQLSKTMNNTLRNIKHHENPFRLSGELKRLSLESLLAYVAGLDRACEIELALGLAIKGHIYLENGLIAEAKLAELSGLKAFSLLLEHAQSEFNVREFDPSFEKTINLAITDAVSAAREVL